MRSNRKNRIKKILIANRGEIVLRIIRTCKKLGIKTVALYAKNDHNKLIEEACDEYIHIRGNSIDSTHLNIEKIIKIAKLAKADAIHPGYGFLSENPKFARACKKNKIIFIGPSEQALLTAAHKISAKNLAIKLGIKVIPGSKVLSTKKEAIEFAKKTGYPIIIKSCEGGGGKGMRIARNRKELANSFHAATNELSHTFGQSALYAEKYMKARHIEFQFLSDMHGNTVHLFCRDCSIQRRFQKLVEEAPSTGLNSKMREKIGMMVKAIAKSISYAGAGTVEFLLTEHNELYFLEINPRIQVEHGITEMITGIDIVKEQIRIAEGRPLSIKQEDVKINGHAIECRIVAESARRGFAPAEGKVSRLVLEPHDAKHTIRIDTAIYTGMHINPHYDSLLAKVIVWDRTRKSAIRTMEKLLASMRIEGVANTIDFCRFIMNDNEFVKGKISTEYLNESKIIEKYAKMSLSPEIIAVIISAIYETDSMHEIEFTKPDAWTDEARKESVGLGEEQIY